MFCNNCGEANPNGASYCLYCGARIAGGAGGTRSRVRKVICETCGGTGYEKALRIQIGAPGFYKKPCPARCDHGYFYIEE